MEYLDEVSIEVYMWEEWNRLQRQQEEDRNRLRQQEEVIIEQTTPSGNGDVSIEVYMWEEWNRLQRQQEEDRNRLRQQEEVIIEQTTPSGNGNVVSEDHEAKNNMDLTLYRAATQAHVGEFINVFEQFANEKGLALSDVFVQKSPVRNTYLHIAASCNNDEIVTWIAQYFPSLINKPNFNGDTALHLAARAGFLNTVNALLIPSVEMENEQEYFSLRIKNKKKNTALHEALMNSREDIASRLIIEDIKGAFELNNERESPLSLAAKAGYQECISLIFSLPREELAEMIELVKDGKSPVHAAITSRNRDVLKLMVSKAPELLRFKDEVGRYPLHYAASRGYLEEVCYLLDNFPANAIERDKDGFLPIHWASWKGEVAVIKKLLQHSPHSVELLDRNGGGSILHWAAKGGRYEVVGYILKDPTLEGLITMKDKKGNTPLHSAAKYFQPKIVSALTWDSRVNLNIVNDEGKTALDVAMKNKDDAFIYRQWLTCNALIDGGVARARPRKLLNDDLLTTSQKEAFKPKDYTDRVNTLLIVSTLVATVTFAAGFTMPGGYNNSDPYQGLATMLDQGKFQMFIFCDTIAMYSSIIVSVSLIWAQLGDPNLVVVVMRVATPLLGIALAMMSIAFMVGVSVVVSKLKWLDCTLLIVGVTFVYILWILFLPLYTPISSNRVLRYMSYFSFALLIYVTKPDFEGDQEDILMAA